MTVTIEYEGKKFKAEGDFPVFVLEEVLREAGILEDDEDVFFLSREESYVVGK